MFDGLPQRLIASPVERPSKMKSSRRIVHGTPITPVRLLDTLAGNSFCVSFAAPEQLDQCVDLVNNATDQDGHDQILVLDNGAFSIWRAQLEGRKLPKRLQFDSPAEYRQAFWAWANEAQRRCPQAVAVIPDVIEGSEHDNLLEMSWALREGLAEFPERTMSIWHMNESQDFLATQCKLMNFIGIGSCAEFDVQRNKPAYLEVIERIYVTVTTMEAVHGNRPWVHLMRGLGIFHKCAWADSADSANVAMNHHRGKAKGHGELRALHLSNRVEAPIQEAAAAIPLAGEAA